MEAHGGLKEAVGNTPIRSSALYSFLSLFLRREATIITIKGRRQKEGRVRHAVGNYGS
jgi:hypothetical protein